MIGSKELYQHLLGLSQPWTVSHVELDVARQHVHVYAKYPIGRRCACPECGRKCVTFDTLVEHVWRHLDSGRFLTYLHASPPCISCPQHGVLLAQLPCGIMDNRFAAHSLRTGVRRHASHHYSTHDQERSPTKGIEHRQVGDGK